MAFTDTLNEVGENVYTAMDNLDINPLTAGAIGAVSGLAVGGVTGYLVGSRKRKRKSKIKNRKRQANSRKGKSRRKKTRRSIRRTPHTAGKRRDTSHRRIRYTKNGQPYVIMRSGKARFIKKRGAKLSHKRKGGRY